MCPKLILYMVSTKNINGPSHVSVSFTFHLSVEMVLSEYHRRSEKERLQRCSQPSAGTDENCHHDASKLRFSITSLPVSVTCCNSAAAFTALCRIGMMCHECLHSKHGTTAEIPVVFYTSIGQCKTPRPNRDSKLVSCWCAPEFGCT